MVPEKMKGKKNIPLIILKSHPMETGLNQIGREGKNGPNNLPKPSQPLPP